jgi:GNAT superfamily N-acetyltransferase
MSIPAMNSFPRPATPADIPGLLELTDLLVAHDRQFDPSLDIHFNHSPEGLAWLNETLAASDSCVFVLDGAAAALDGVLFGHIEAPEPWRDTGGPLAELEMLCVAPSRRGQGAGKVLVDAFTAWAREHGAARLWVRVSAGNTGAVRFYRREAFADYDVILERPLEPR